MLEILWLMLNDNVDFSDSLVCLWVIEGSGKSVVETRRAY